MIPVGQIMQYQLYFDFLKMFIDPVDFYSVDFYYLV